MDSKVAQVLTTRLGDYFLVYGSYYPHHATVWHRYDLDYIRAVYRVTWAGIEALHGMTYDVASGWNSDVGIILLPDDVQDALRVAIELCPAAVVHVLKGLDDGLDERLRS